ncbi:family 43 glycosylhydrolase [Mucilaginibacter lutimaris]|uniref:Family 43 glycosylhydrolase n=2 Tax=Mucilaginibacter lutimaris TaxID=931629 RepID=A0ABW2ZM51_9SPHI
MLVITTIAASAQIKNFNKNGGQITRFSTIGNAVDAHDGEIAYFDGTYYLYGTSYDCGFQWGNKGAPFCGFKVYSSKDMNSWTDRGYLFDATTAVWQTRCDGKTYGCFRPHVIYNQKNKLYVLWINVYDNRVGYRVFTSKTPVGPFNEVAEPHLAVNSDMPIAGLNNGDHDTFIDDDGTAYLAFTDWRTKGTIVIEKLSDDYLTGTGEFVKGITEGETEAPGLFKRKGIYYVVYSDPNCGYCSGTGTSYRTAPSPLGPWSKPTKISDNSCGGQPSFVSTIKINSETVYLYGSDLWNNAAKNEALANFYWAPLTFAADGSINPLKCFEVYKMPRALPSTPPKGLDATSGQADFSLKGDIKQDTARAQYFTIKRSGKLNKLEITVFKNNYPDADLLVEIYKANKFKQPAGLPLSTQHIPADAIGWSAKNIMVKPNMRVLKGQQYVFVLKSASTKGCYGYAYSDFAPNAGGGASLSTNGGNGGKTFKPEAGRTLKFRSFVTN